MGTGRGSPFYEVISQKIFNLTNDGFPYDDSGGGEGDDGFEYNDVIAAPTSIRPPETKKRPPKKPSRQGTPAPPRSPPSPSPAPISGSSRVGLDPTILAIFVATAVPVIKQRASINLKRL